jgi:very-short-patch-repair endonuclease
MSVATQNKACSPRPDQRVEAVKLSVGNAEKLKQMVSDFTSVDRPGTSTDFSKSVTKILSTIAAPHGTEQKEVLRIIGVAKGAVTALGRQANGPDQDLRIQAIRFTEEVGKALALPQTNTAPEANKNINDRIIYESKGDRTEYVKFFLDSLESKERSNWNSVNLVTAMYRLCSSDPNWASRTYGRHVAETFIEAFLDISRREALDAQSLCTLSPCVPHVLNALSRTSSKNSGVEKDFIEGLGKAVVTISQLPDATFVQDKILLPLRHLKSHTLTDQAATSLCGYVAKVNEVVAQVRFADTIELTAMTFHGLNGISSWHKSTESQADLVSVLSSLNNRLEKSTVPFNSITAGSIVYGLRGMDVRALNQDACKEVARTLRLAASKINRMPPGEPLNYKAVGSIMCGLTVCLDTKEGPVYNATKELCKAVQARLPTEMRTMEDLGLLCGALLPLRRHFNEHKPLINAIFADIDRAPKHLLITDRGDRGHLVSWQTIQQAYALFERRIPIEVQRKLVTLEPFAQKESSVSKSESRVADWVRDIPGVRLNSSRYVDGFEIDISFTVGSPSAPHHINIEVDGSHHKEPAQELCDSLRDIYLRKVRGWQVVRIPSSADQEFVTEYVRNIVEQYRLGAPQPVKV